MQETINTLEASEEEVQETAAEELPTVDFNATVEAILFAAGHPMTYDQIGKVMECSPSYVKERVQEYALEYNTSELSRGVMLLAFDDCCQLCTKEAYLPYIREALGIRRSGNLSNSSIETLAIIAYNQPVTRSYVDTVRGVDSSYAVSSLLERGLIEAKGRLDAPGRPMLYGTSPDFLRCFGLHSLEELPGVTADEAQNMLRRMQQQQISMELPDENQLTMDDTVPGVMPKAPEATNDMIGDLSEGVTPDEEN